MSNLNLVRQGWRSNEGQMMSKVELKQDYVAKKTQNGNMKVRQLMFGPFTWPFLSSPSLLSLTSNHTSNQRFTANT